MTNENCVFCKIVNGEIPTPKIYEDEKFISFLDNRPLTKGHALLIPKDHVAWMHEAPDSMVGDIFVITKKMMKNIIEKLPCDFVQIGVAGNEVPHFHVHLIPRSMTEELEHHPRLTYESDAEIQSISSKIKM